MTSRIADTTWQPGSWREFEIGNYYVKDLSTNTMLVSGTAKSSFTGDESIKLNYSYDPGSSQYKFS